MNKKLTMAVFVSACLLLAACQNGKQPTSGGSAPAETVVEPVTEISSEVSGEIETENYDEETGEILEEFEIESEVNTVQDTLTLNLSSNAEAGYSWKYLIENEDVLEMVGETYVENEAAEGEAAGQGRTYLSFRAKAEGSSNLYLFYLESEVELDIPEGESPEDFSDLSYLINVTTNPKDGMLKVALE
ncbi:MAG: protease inhibitor I42 family protein [Blautia sp.]|nr:protease inhibitor I42 family protein [Blautia sp.]